jgi:hypothetical protein
MARGSAKSDAVAVVNQPLNAAQRLSKEWGSPQVREPFDALMQAVEAYQGDRHFMREGHKERRQEIANAFKALPKWLQKRLGEPQSAIKELYRGADHPANPGPDGKVHASFSKDPSWAQFFQRGNPHLPERIAGQTRLYSVRDIKSFDGIFNLRKLRDFREEVANELKRKYEKSIHYPKNFVGTPEYAEYQALLLYKEASSQDEYLVMDIKWRKGAGQG